MEVWKKKKKKRNLIRLSEILVQPEPTSHSPLPNKVSPVSEERAGEVIYTGQKEDSSFTARRRGREREKDDGSRRRRWGGGVKGGRGRKG